MKMSEITEKSAKELVALGRELRKDLFNLHLQKASSQLEKPARLRLLRRDIARVETALSGLRKKSKTA